MGTKTPEEATLLDVLVDGFEKNEILGGFHWRDLPLSDVESARRKFLALADEATRWKGAPERKQLGTDRQIVAWADLEIRQAGRGIMVRARAPWFDGWWNDRDTWQGDPMGPLFAWLEEERAT